MAPSQTWRGNKSPVSTNLISTILILPFLYHYHLNCNVKDAVAGIDVGVLVNNVGISYPYTQYFHELDDERYDSIMRINYLLRFVAASECSSS